MQRNRQDKDDAEYYDDYKETKAIDYELKQSIRYLPAEWWDIAALNSEATDMEVVGETARLITRLHHHYYLAILHQPYNIDIVRQQHSTSNGPAPIHPSAYVYSQAAALSATRGLLTCFSTLRTFHRVLSYRPIDDKALTAAIIILLIHLDGHRLGRENVHEHQRPHDLKLVNSVIKSIKETCRWNKDALSKRSIQILERLVEIEADSLTGSSYVMWIEEAELGKKDGPVGQKTDDLRLPIPYFGVLNIARHRPDSHPAANFIALPDDVSGSTDQASTAFKHRKSTSPACDLPSTSLSMLEPPRSASPASGPFNIGNDIPWQLSSQPHSEDFSSVFQDTSLPIQSINEQDWLHQDLDSALLESWLVRETQGDNAAGVEL
jgi:hypothetical protein